MLTISRTVKKSQRLYETRRVNATLQKSYIIFS